MKHRTAMGKMLDMTALRTKNEHVRAVGNMNVNARGDTIDSNGNVIEDNTKRVNQHYMRSVMNRQPQDKPPRAPAPAQTQTAPEQPQRNFSNAQPDEVYNSSAAPSDLDDDIPNPKK